MPTTPTKRGRPKMDNPDAEKLILTQIRVRPDFKLKFDTFISSARHRNPVFAGVIARDAVCLFMEKYKNDPERAYSAVLRAEAKFPSARNAYVPGPNQDPTHKGKNKSDAASKNTAQIAVLLTATLKKEIDEFIDANEKVSYVGMYRASLVEFLDNASGDAATELNAEEKKILANITSRKKEPGEPPSPKPPILNDKQQDQLIELMTSYNGTMKDLADAVGVDLSHISRIVHKKRLPSQKLLDKIVAKLNADADLFRQASV